MSYFLYCTYCTCAFFYIIRLWHRAPEYAIVMRCTYTLEHSVLHGVSLAAVGSGWADSDLLLGYFSARLRTLFLEPNCT